MTVTMTPGIDMADAIVPANLPPLFAAYAGYDNGRWDDFQAIKAEHPAAELLDFTVFFANVGTGGDFELGDMAAVAAPGYVDLRHAAGVARPVCYASIEGEMPAIAAALSSRPRSSYRLLSAHYNGQRHICGPATCGSPIQCDGTQWVDHGGWDESVLSDDFFVTPEPAGPAVSASGAGQLVAGQILLPGQALWAPDGYALVVQADGNLVVRAPGNVAKWGSGTSTAGSILVAQADGNFVLVAPGNKPVWSTCTAGHPGTALVMQGDGNLVAYGPGHAALWASGS